MANLERAFVSFINTEEYHDFKEFFDASRNNKIVYKDDWETSLIDYFLNYTVHGKRYSVRNIKTLKTIFKKHSEHCTKQEVPASIMMPLDATRTNIDDIIEISFQDVDDEWRRSRFEMSKYKVNLEIFDDVEVFHEPLELIKKESPVHNITAKKIVNGDVCGVFLVRNPSKSDASAASTVESYEEDVELFSDFDDEEEDGSINSDYDDEF